jgi:hypothetical protein
VVTRVVRRVARRWRRAKGRKGVKEVERGGAKGTEGAKEVERGGAKGTEGAKEVEREGAKGRGRWCCRYQPRNFLRQPRNFLRQPRNFLRQPRNFLRGSVQSASSGAAVGVCVRSSRSGTAQNACTTGSATIGKPTQQSQSKEELPSEELVQDLPSDLRQLQLLCT